MAELSGVQPLAVPPAPVEEFQAPLCGGALEENPRENIYPPTEVPDLTMVTGPRLDAYNEGAIVPLYDSYGSAFDAYPPLCATWYDAEVDGPVSGWKLCTDRTADVCGDAGPEGELMEGGQQVNYPTTLERNERLTADQERLVVYLLVNGHSYAGVGNQSWGGVTQAGYGSSAELHALQTLVWCVTDPTDVASDFATTCEANMSDDHQQMLLSSFPSDPTIEITASDAATLGETVTFTLTTNALNQPIELAYTGTGTLTVSSGPGTLSGTTLQVDGTSTEETVVLEVTPDEAGDVGLTASVSLVAAPSVTWASSLDNADVTCQVFATLTDAPVVSAEDAASVTVVEEDEPTTPAPTTEDPTTPTTPAPTTDVTTDAPSTEATTTGAASDDDLAATGANGVGAGVAMSIAAVVAGAALLLVRRRHQARATR